LTLPLDFILNVTRADYDDLTFDNQSTNYVADKFMINIDKQQSNVEIYSFYRFDIPAVLNQRTVSVTSLRQQQLFRNAIIASRDVNVFAKFNLKYVKKLNTDVQITN